MLKRIHPIVSLLLLAIVSYGLLIPQLGFYWDDLPMSWIRYQLGADAMTRYFSTNRPVWALLYQVTTHIFPHQPIYWQVFALFWRWLGAAVLFAVGKHLFPKSPNFPLALSALFLIYPGFNQQWASYLYSHFFIVIFFFLVSYLFMLRGKTIPALIFSALNLWMMEYFFVLELIRPFVIFTSLRAETSSWKIRLKTTFKLYLPYLAVFILAVLSRLFIFNNQVYQIGLEEETTTSVFSVFDLLKNVFTSLWVTTGAAWAQVFQFPVLSTDGPRTTLVYIAVLLLTGSVVFFTRVEDQPAIQESRAEIKWILGIGILMLGLAGPPFWLTGVPVSLGFPANRATLSFMFGVSFLLAGLLELLPVRFKQILIVMLALAAGRQFLWSNEFRRDWVEHKNMFWQMTWRAPALQENTIVLINEELNYYADNSLGAALNWIYAPDNHSDQINYVLFYPTNRKTLSLQPDTPLEYDFLAGKFLGNTSQTVVFYYAPPKCLRLLDPEIDTINKLIPDDTLLRDAASLSSSQQILNSSGAVMPTAYGEEPVQGWCYYFQKADLARQYRNWEEVTRLGEIAFSLGDYPNDPVERFVYIEGYAHTEDWKKAVELSKLSYKVSKAYVGPLLCKLWDRIERETDANPEQEETLGEVRSEFECIP